MNKTFEDYVAKLMERVDGTLGEKLRFAHDHAVINMLNDLAAKISKLEEHQEGK